MKSYLRAAGLLFNQPLLTTPDALDMAVRWANQVMSLNIINLAPRSDPALWHGDDDHAAALAREDERRRLAIESTGVQVLPVHGLLVSRGAHMNVCETMTSYEDLRNDLRRAVSDPRWSALCWTSTALVVRPLAPLNWPLTCVPWRCKSPSPALSTSRPTAAAT